MIEETYSKSRQRRATRFSGNSYSCKKYHLIMRFKNIWAILSIHFSTIFCLEFFVLKINLISANNKVSELNFKTVFINCKNSEKHVSLNESHVKYKNVENFRKSVYV